MLFKSKIKYLQSLSQKKIRKEADHFLVEAPKGVAEILLEHPEQIEEIYALPSWIKDAQNNPALQAALQKVAPSSVVEIEEFELNKISQLQTPNQVLALVKKPIWPVFPKGVDFSSLFSSPLEESPLQAGEDRDKKSLTPIWLFLEDIQDPGNMGTILRMSDWFGVSGVIATRESVDFFHPKVIQSTMGSIWRVPTFYAELSTLQECSPQLPMWAASLQGQDIRTISAPKTPVVLAIGNESKGLSEACLKLARQSIMIPRFGKAESLNAAVATSVLLGWLRL